MTRAAILMIIGMCCIPLGDTAGRILITDHDTAPIFVAWTRFGLGALILLPFLPEKARMPAVMVDPRVLLRAAFMSAGIWSILTALKTTPIAAAFGAFFIGPVISYVLSILLLRERVTPFRTGLMAVGFSGVVLIVWQGLDASPGILFAVIAGVFYGAFLTASRWLADVARPRHLLASQLVFGGIVLAPLALAEVPTITPTVAALILASALCSMTGNLLLILSYCLAPATRLAPLVYVQLIAASVYGWLIFGDQPAALTWAGLGLLLVSGLAALALRR